MVERIKLRDKEEGKFIPPLSLRQLMGAFEFPLMSEGFDEVRVVIGGKGK